jgi:hypothetical protein
VRPVFSLIIGVQSVLLFAQNDSIKKLIVNGYGEGYYSYDFSHPQNNEKAAKKAAKKEAKALAKKAEKEWQ